jgi:hypothetical protein
MYIKRNVFRILFILIMPLSISFSQELDKVVFVESAFKPIIEDANKIGSMPLLTDTLNPKPEISYSILPSRIDAKYEIKPIKAATLVGSPLDKLYNSRAVIGLGNYTTPLVEFSIHNLRSKEYAVGAYAYHKSSHTKLTLENDHKVPAGYGTNKFMAYGKRFYKNVNVEGELDFNSQKNRLYGYNTANFTDSLPDMENKDIRQWYSQIRGKAEVYSTVPDSNAFQYRLALIADYFGDDYANSQNHVDIPGKLSFKVYSFRLNLNARLHYFQSVLDTLRGTNDYLFQFNPVLSKKGDQWQIFVGANTYVSSYGKANFFPEAKLSFVVLEKAMEAYCGISGYLEINNFSKIANENVYIQSGLNTKNTKHKLIGYGGLKGLFSSNSGYQIEAKFESIENMYFFQNDTTTELENTFIPVYDDIELVKLSTELWYSPYTYLDFYFKASHYTYNQAIELKPWHKADLNLSFTTQYNFKEKIYANIDIIYVGKRYAKNFSDLANPIELKGIWDVNLGLEYRYSNVLSAFVNVHNLLSQQYYLWNQYPSQKINFLIGFSYKF